MPVNEIKYKELVAEFAASNVQLIAVSKIQSVNDIKRLYDLGQRDFGENYVQELVAKQSQLPADIRWHFIGHLQSNKVKLIAPIVHLIQGVDSLKLLVEINKQAKKTDRVIHCLLQVHIAHEDTKFGLDEEELDLILSALKDQPSEFANIIVDGLMGMASFSDDQNKVSTEMKALKSLFEKYKVVCLDNDLRNCTFSILSMGMSGDYELAIKEGSNMVRIGSLLFGARL